MHTKRCRCPYLMTSWGQLDESCLSVDQDNIVEVKRKFEEIRLDRSMKKFILQEIPVAVLAFGISCTFAKNH